MRKYVHFISSKNEKELTPEQILALESAFIVYQDCLIYCWTYPDTWQNLPLGFIRCPIKDVNRETAKAMVTCLYGGIYMETYLYSIEDMRLNEDMAIVTKEVIFCPVRESKTLNLILTTGKGWSKIKKYEKYFVREPLENHLDYLKSYHSYVEQPV